MLGVLVFLTTDYTDYTDSSLTVPSQVQPRLSVSSVGSVDFLGQLMILMTLILASRCALACLRGACFLTTDFTDYTDASLAECEFCLTQRAQNAQRCTCCACAPSGCLLCCPRRTRMVTNLLSTDDTDATDFCTRCACALGDVYIACSGFADIICRCTAKVVKRIALQ